MANEVSRRQAMQDAPTYWWDRQNVWSQAATKLKVKIQRARRFLLALAVVAAITGTASAQMEIWRNDSGRYAAFAAAVAAGLTPLAGRGSRPSLIRDWTRIRSVSEAIKAEVLTYLAHVSPYRENSAAENLWDRCSRFEQEAADLMGHAIGILPKERQLPPVGDVDTYCERRIQGQIRDYYRPQTLNMKRRENAVHYVASFFAIAATVLAGVSGALGIEHAAVWVATAATMGTAVIAYGTAARYSYQYLEYSRTADELQRLLAGRQLVGGAASHHEDDRFVAQCERIISAQNEAWMTSWKSEE
ncbi:DUF4231 domain-containing protein [Streptomyces sp. NBC_01481]|uniref:DUF4231 domain-containing protein n=1 Tax=Streptomyces sp. NBC_01481 TaxID=2975869 RepID=UPI002251FF87|nr:DUF4231 domain-containing protein [Streptomyces sp. NBC_01481]MCX4585060.1 DUF4231 domain-containing protein [Streptomyces sp. NBC_01481]